MSGMTGTTSWWMMDGGWWIPQQINGEKRSKTLQPAWVPRIQYTHKETRRVIYTVAPGGRWGQDCVPVAMSWSHTYVSSSLVASATCDSADRLFDLGLLYSHILCCMLVYCRSDETRIRFRNMNEREMHHRPESSVRRGLSG